jgi:hypothetical protein
LISRFVTFLDLLRAGQATRSHSWLCCHPSGSHEFMTRSSCAGDRTSKRESCCQWSQESWATIATQTALTDQTILSFASSFQSQPNRLSEGLDKARRDSGLTSMSVRFSFLQYQRPEFLLRLCLSRQGADASDDIRHRVIFSPPLTLPQHNLLRWSCMRSLRLPLLSLSGKSEIGQCLYLYPVRCH